MKRNENKEAEDNIDYSSKKKQKYAFNGVLREPMSDLERMMVSNPGRGEATEEEVQEFYAENRDTAKVKKKKY